MGRLAAGGDRDGGFTQPVTLPGGELPRHGPVVPFQEEGTAGGDLLIAVAAIVDDEVDAAALLLPAAGGGQVKRAFAGLDAVGAVFRVPLVGVGSMREGEQPGSGRLLAQQGEELIRLGRIDRRHAHHSSGID